MSSAFAVIASVSGLVLEAAPLLPSSVCDLIGVYAAAAPAGELVLAATMAVPGRLRNLLHPTACAEVRAAFRRAYLHGDLRLAQWLAGHFSLSPADARACSSAALRWACGNGHLATAQWLVARFGLTAADARDNDNEALRRAFEGGHLAAAQWLGGRFGLTAADAGEHAAMLGAPKAPG